MLWQPLPKPSPVELIAQVSEGTLSYAIVGSLAAAIARNIYLDFDVAFPAGDKRPFAWAVPDSYPGLREDLDRFFERVKRDGTLARLIERYVPDSSTFLRLDASGLMERMRTVLPQYQQLFHDAQERTGIEWRLLAALAFQESKWDAAATSETGVRGFMQLTEDTAKRMGVTNLLDPAQNVLAGARYLSDLKRRLPERIQEPDRTWLALAAYNIGLGPPRGRAGARAAAGPRSRPLDQREEGAAAARAARALRDGRSSATRAAACRSRSSTACAATTTCCSRISRRLRRGCVRSPVQPATAASEPTTAQR